MYVTDSLFFIQHIFGGAEEEKRVFSMRYADIVNNNDIHAEEPNADEIIEKMREKARLMK